MKAKKTARAGRVRRHRRVRKKLEGTAQRPRLCVFRSLARIYAQVIDDGTGRTLVAASDLDKEVRSSGDTRPKAKAAALVGALIGRRAKEKGIEQVVFDRGGYRYHGRVKALAEAAREEGLRF